MARYPVVLHRPRMARRLTETTLAGVRGGLVATARKYTARVIVMLHWPMAAEQSLYWLVYICKFGNPLLEYLPAAASCRKHHSLSTAAIIGVCVAAAVATALAGL